MKIEFLIASFSVLAPLSAFFAYKTQICLHYGKAMASQGFLEMKPTGYQDALTDPRTNKWFFLAQGCLLVNVVSFFYFTSFWAGLGSIASYLVITAILSQVLPPPNSLKWAAGIYSSLVRREADYKRDGDELRYEAMKDIREKFELKFIVNAG